MRRTTSSILKGAAYGLFAENLKELNAIENMERLFKTAKQSGLPVFVSPHGYFPTDQAWQDPGALVKQLLKLGIFARKDAVYAGDLKGSGADFLARYKPYILDGKTVVASPHKVLRPAQQRPDPAAAQPRRRYRRARRPGREPVPELAPCVNWSRTASRSPWSRMPLPHPVPTPTRRRS